MTPAWSLNNTFIQASVREERGLTIASTPTHTSNHRDDFRNKRQQAPQLQGRQSQQTEREQSFLCLSVLKLLMLLALNDNVSFQQ